jgi:serine/threonine protein kinase
MDIISSQEFNDICHDDNTVIIKFGKIDQPKVFEKNGNTIIKLFYPKKSKLSSDRIRPRAMRFYHNVKLLQKYGYNAPVVTKVQFCPDLKIYLMYYAKIQGCDVRNLAKNGKLDIIRHVAHLLANLHTNGIFFRSVHLENLLYQPDGQFALLDVTDVRFKRKALTFYSRYRNLKHLLQEPHDRDVWQAFGVNDFMNEYFKSANLSTYSRSILSYLIKRRINIIQSA